MTNPLTRNDFAGKRHVTRAIIYLVLVFVNRDIPYDNL